MEEPDRHMAYLFARCYAPPSPRVRGEGWGEGAPALPERCGRKLGHRKTPLKLRQR